MRSLLVVPLLLISLDAGAGAPPDGGTPTRVTGRVTDDTGRPLASLEVRLTDTTRFSGHVDARGCGTYYVEESVFTDADGRFSATLPFRPNRAILEDQEWVKFPRDLRVDPDAPILLVGRAIPHRTLTGVVVDEAGQPIAEARVEPPNTVWTRTDSQGRFTLETGDPPPAELRIRRMGFKPLFVPSSASAKVVLTERRALVTVTVLDPQTKQPVERFVTVSLWKGDERMSFCTAGRPNETHEAQVGTCVLDTDPGTITLKLDNVVKQTLKVVGAAPQAVTVTAAPFVPPAFPTSGY